MSVFHDEFACSGLSKRHPGKVQGNALKEEGTAGVFQICLKNEQRITGTVPNLTNT